MAARARFVSYAAKEGPRDVSPLMQNTKKHNCIILPAVVIDQKIWSDAHHSGNRAKRRPRRAASRKLSKPSQSEIEAAAEIDCNALAGLLLKVSYNIIEVGVGVGRDD
jgi:hypothetical protein